MQLISKDNNIGNADKPVILQVLPRLVSGGVERGTVEIAGAVARMGFRSLVASAGGPMVGDVYNAGAQHLTLPLDSKNPITIVMNYFRLCKIIKKQRVSLIHARSRAPAWSAFLAAKRMDCPFVTTFHGIYGTGNRLKRWYNSVMVKGKIVIAVSNYVKDHIKQYYQEDDSNIRLIHRGVDITQFSPEAVAQDNVISLKRRFNIKDDQPVILLPGRITRWKGHMFLLKALTMTSNRNFLCLIVGDEKSHPDFTKELHQFITKNDLEPYVKITGTMGDMPTLYSLADIVISASTAPEAFGRIAIEAQAMGKILIATNHGGSCETVIPGKTGWLVEPDNYEGLAKTLDNALNLNPEMKTRVGKHAFDHIKTHFTLENMCIKTLDIYRELIENQQSTSK